MDFLDSLDADCTDKKSSRIRSWYMYEQYKSLERSQLDAAQKMKDKCFQERILYQELSERRLRRLGHQCDSISQFQQPIKTDSMPSINTDYLDIGDINENEYVIQPSELKSEAASVKLEETDLGIKNTDDDLLESDIHTDSGVNNTDSDIINTDMDDNITKDISEQLETVKKVKDENDRTIECLKSLNDFCDDKLSEMGSDVSEFDVKNEFEPNGLGKTECDVGGNAWTKLVCFAYQVVQLNHGNCYSDFSCQLLMAVLACDILRRGVGEMCEFLQPYVSPVKFASDKSVVVLNMQNNFIAKEHKKLHRNSCIFKCRQKNHQKYKKCRRHHQSESMWPVCSKWQHRRWSDPCRSVARSSENCSSTTIDIFEGNVENIGHHSEQIVKENPMLKLLDQIDKVLIQCNNCPNEKII